MDTKQFWQERAKVKGVQAVNFDENMNTLENKAIEPFIKGCKRVLDVGCGNGETLRYLANLYPEIRFYGIDSSEEMIVSAQANNRLRNVSFVCMDAKDMKYINSFDAVIGKRLLINVVEDDDRIKVLDNIEASLKEDGKYIMVENFIEPLLKINELRELLGYELIKIHEFNKYLNEDFIKTVEANDLCRKEFVDFGSLYYFTSRIFNTDGLYESKINLDAIKMSLHGYSNIISGYSPEKMIVFEKTNGSCPVGGLDRDL